MNIQSMIELAWNSVQFAHVDGFLHSHDMYVFAFCKALPEKISTTYDGRQIHNTTHRPNFFVWSKGDTPEVTFVGKLRFGPLSSEVVEQDLLELNRYFSNLEIDVLTDGEKRTETCMLLSPDVQFGYFLLADIPRQSVEKKIQFGLNEDQRRRFHFAYGPASHTNESHQAFIYSSPKT